jgi:non-specific serine/threonine protein kinase
MSETSMPEALDASISEGSMSEPALSEPSTPEPPLSEEDELLRLAEDISEGRDVDWDSHPSFDGNSAQWIQNLRSLEALAAAMRREPPPLVARTLEPGSRIGRFVVEGPSRKGGMGIVYLARDAALERPVALKLLPPDVTHSPDRVAKLAREARLLASMNHPNIATIYGLEEGGGGVLVLVLEWLPGETLADRLRNGSLPLRDALDVCGQIAQGLATAHAGGVIHRDLKPANVMFGVGGRVKVVDFGLARKRPMDGNPSESSADTLVAGTWGYLSPECLIGNEDHRADVFAFGCVLFECLVGSPAFPGNTAEEIRDSVLHHEPDLSLLPAHCPPAIRRILGACLEKDPDRRASSIAEAARVIEATLGRRPGAQPSPSTNLPTSNASFVGRTVELDQLRRLLRAGCLATLTGPGGAGKTRLAIALGQQIEHELPGGAWFVDLAPVLEGSRALAAVAGALGVKSDPPLPLFEQITRRLKDTRALLIFDNCEHISKEVAPLVGDLIASCPSISILATSRGPLQIAGESVVRVDPLPVPSDHEIDDPEALARCHSVCLFVERATESNPGFIADASALQSAGEICRRVEGLPLAIELAAARVRVMNLEEISSRLDRQLQLLRDSTGRMTPRHRALHATIGWSVDQLRPEEARTFRRFAVFAGSWDLAATAYVCEVDEFDALDLLSSLVDKSLVTVVPAKSGSTRYRFLEPVRQFAWDALVASGEDVHGTRRHADHFLALAEEAEPHLYGPEQGRWLERLAAEHANMLAALDTCHQDPEGVERGLRLAGALGRYWHVRGYAELGMAQLDRVLGRMSDDGSSAPRARAIAVAGALASWRGDARRAIAHLQDALTRFRELSDRRGESRALLALGPALCETGDTARGQVLCEEGLEAAREVGDLRGEATALVNLGVLAYGRGDRAGAHRLFGEAVDLHRQSGDRVTLALALGNRSALSVQLGNFAAASAELTEALHLSVDLDAVLAGTSAIGTAAMLALTRRELADAAWMLGAATECVETSGLNLSPSQRHQLDQLVSQVRASLDPSRFDLAWANGRAMSFPDAASRVVSWLSSHADPD